MNVRFSLSKEISYNDFIDRHDRTISWLLKRSPLYFLFVWANKSSRCHSVLLVSSCFLTINLTFQFCALVLIQLPFGLITPIRRQDQFLATSLQSFRMCESSFSLKSNPFSIVSRVDEPMCNHNHNIQEL